MEKNLSDSAQKIRQNHAEEKALKENLHKLLSGDKVLASKPLVVGKTPNALVICGANDDLELTIKKSTIDKCLRPEIRGSDGKMKGKTGHGLTEELLLQALNGMKTPTMILKGSRENSLVVVTDLKDHQDRTVIVAVELNKAEGFREVNNITSTYGRNSFIEFLKQKAERGEIIAINKDKANEMLHSIGKQYPKENTFISFNDSIAYSMQNVKYPIKEISKPSVLGEIYKIQTEQKEAQAESPDRKKAAKREKSSELS